MNADATRSLPDPRIERTRTAVIDAAWGLLGEVGFDRITIEAVSERSGVARSTIYRHWPGTAELVMDAIAVFKADDSIDPLDDPEAALRSHLQALGAVMRSEEESSILLDLAASSARDQNLADLFRAFIDPKRQRSVRQIVALQQDGRLDPDLSTDHLADLVVAPLFHRRIFVGDPMTPAEIDGHLDQILERLGPR